MKIEWSQTFTKEYHHLPSQWQKQFDEKFRLFLQDPRHSSLHVKKMQGTQGIWEARISQSYRWTFELIQSGVRLRHIGSHDILREE
jgi:mRNA-degrading endonuclease RelE of RelBE toxin-antitoxin system